MARASLRHTSHAKWLIGHTDAVLLADLVATSAAVASTRARSTKTAALAELLGRLAPDEIEAAVGFLTGEARQGRIGVGWATVFRVEVDARGTCPA